MDISEHQPVQGLTVEDIWALFRETDRRFQETDRRFQETDRRFQETDRQFKEIALQSKETDRQFKKIALQSKETDRQFKEIALQSKETERKISKLGSRLGELVENLVASNLVGKFNERGFAFSKTSLDVVIKYPDNSLLAEFDIFLENGSTALAVEVKSKLTVDDVKEHLERMEKLRRYADEHGDKRKFLGAAAGGIIPEEVKPFAIKSGLFVIEQSGETAVIAVPEGFKPREW
ncbi:MAG: hypothetical protein LBB78_03335 [Spirochaetaceae bacterium]|jgi:hypothetical protein|nr:hypothetical protein [Spirochaetaceae bacterium]